MASSRRLTIASLFGGIIFLSKLVIPTPMDKMLIIVEALLLALGSLLLSRMGATYVAAVAGLLISVIRGGFFPFSLVFALIYGLLVDGSFKAFKVKVDRQVRRGRLVAALTLSTAAVGLASFYVVTSIGLMPMLPILYLAIILVGIANGVLAGFLTPLIWRRYLAQYAEA